MTTNSPDHNAKGTQSEAISLLLPLVGTRFQDLFHSPPGVLFTFPSRYWCTIGHGRVFSLGGWSPRFPAGFPESRCTQVPRSPSITRFRVRDSHPVPWAVPGRFRYPCVVRRDNAPPGPYNPGSTRNPVWASPRSLAATWGISFDLSSWGYLDVSVLPVGSPRGVTDHDVRRVAPFGYSGITGCVRLPRIYRGLPRPSSPVRAKASTVRPYFAWPNIPIRPPKALPSFLHTRTRQMVREPPARHSHLPDPHHPNCQLLQRDEANSPASLSRYHSSRSLSTARWG